MKNTIFLRLAARLREPSSWAGIAAVAAVFGVPLEHIDAAVQVGVAVAGAAAVILPEKAAS